MWPLHLFNTLPLSVSPRIHISTPCCPSQNFLTNLWPQFYVRFVLILDSAHLFALGVTCHPAYAVQAATSLYKSKVPWWDFETICQNITAPRSVGAQQNKNSGTRITDQTVDTTTNEGNKTMGRGFLSRGFFFSFIFLGGMRWGRRRGFVFPCFPHGTNTT